MRSTWAAIPYRDKPELTCALVKQLVDETGLEGVMLLNHASSGETARQLGAVMSASPRMHFVWRNFHADETLTGMWNAAVDMAIDAGVDTLAFLNNDIAIPVGFIEALEAALWADDALWAVCPDWHRSVAQGMAPGQTRYVTGVERHGGMCGWAFAVKVGAWTIGGLPRFDPRCQFWGADDDLAFSIEKWGYRIGLVEGVPVDHLHSQTLITRPELVSVCHDDLEYVRQKWGR